jgi:hypothetical protein
MFDFKIYYTNGKHWILASSHCILKTSFDTKVFINKITVKPTILQTIYTVRHTDKNSLSSANLYILSFYPLQGQSILLFVIIPIRSIMTFIIAI